ncbi:MAG: restriction endonuclease subunit S [Bacteroidetes bacterium]|nr:restriction endonuclease subunit S [Bacteroidota bacterium]
MNNELVNPQDLPKGWVKTSVGEISDKIHYGYTASAVFKDVGPKLLRITDIQENKVDWDTVPNCKIDIAEIEKFLLSENDLVFARTGATVGKSFLIKLDIPKAVFASYLIRIKLDQSVNPDFIYCYFQSSNYWRQISDSKLGIGQPNINATILSNLSLPLPPLPEQHRIVAKLEELFTKLDVSVAELKKAKAQIKRYRQSVLKHAFEGKLTEQWRIANGELRNETAEELLVKIKDERKKALGKKYKELPPVDTTNLPKLPEGWVWVRIDDISQVISGNAFKSTDFIDSGIPVVKIGNVGYGEFIWKDQEYFPKERFKGVKDFEIKSGDLLFALTRPITNNRTKVCLYPTDSQIGLLNQRVAVIKTSEIVIKNYLQYFLQSEDFKSKIKLLFTETLQPNLSPIDLKEVKIPFTSFNELNQIVLEIERHFSVADETEKIIDQSLKQAERLCQSILKDAFCGKLVPQDPNDPPASLLLEKIKAEKEKLAKEPKTKKSNRRTGRKVVGEDKAEREK